MWIWKKYCFFFTVYKVKFFEHFSYFIFEKRFPKVVFSANFSLRIDFKYFTINAIKNVYKSSNPILVIKLSRIKSKKIGVFNTDL